MPIDEITNRDALETIIDQLQALNAQLPIPPDGFDVWRAKAQLLDTAAMVRFGIAIYHQTAAHGAEWTGLKNAWLELKSAWLEQRWRG